MGITNKAREAQTRRTAQQSSTSHSGGTTHNPGPSSGSGASTFTALEPVTYGPEMLPVIFSLRHLEESFANALNSLKNSIRDQMVRTHNLPTNRGDWQFSYNGITPPTKAGSR